MSAIQASCMSAASGELPQKGVPPFQPLHFQCPVDIQPLHSFGARMFVIVREGPEAPVTGVVASRQVATCRYGGQRTWLG